ncbi:hypothetical protein B0H94_10942 [Salsuginibacillus halophilus]|uniref:Uncharacterized protein n=1 Tax=Salsuginibacillus halophilus TaxID=517424 RepID=A0A2P8HCM3_9BACI|nr:hypothetical protein [Salsuginibacillus halophilus]PSL43986.1 hypothetical protein B0H94_10942 [Salsuginibacillus halophilus]
MKQQGMALPTVLMVFAVLSLVFLTTAAVLLTDLTGQQQTYADIEAQYDAEGQAETLIALLDQENIENENSEDDVISEIEDKAELAGAEDFFFTNNENDAEIFAVNFLGSAAVTGTSDAESTYNLRVELFMNIESRTINEQTTYHLDEWGLTRWERDRGFGENVSDSVDPGGENGGHEPPPPSAEECDPTSGSYFAGNCIFTDWVTLSHDEDFEVEGFSEFQSTVIMRDRSQLTIGDDLTFENELSADNDTKIDAGDNAIFLGELTTGDRFDLTVDGQTNFENDVNIQNDASLTLESSADFIGEFDAGDRLEMEVKSTASFYNLVSIGHGADIQFNQDAVFHDELTVNSNSEGTIQGEAVFHDDVTFSADSNITLEKDAEFSGDLNLGPQTVLTIEGDASFHGSVLANQTAQIIVCGNVEGYNEADDCG